MNISSPVGAKINHTTNPRLTIGRENGQFLHINTYRARFFHESTAYNRPETAYVRAHTKYANEVPKWTQTSLPDREDLSQHAEKKQSLMDIT